MIGRFRVQIPPRTFRFSRPFSIGLLSFFFLVRLQKKKKKKNCAGYPILHEHQDPFTARGSKASEWNAKSGPNVADGNVAMRTKFSGRLESK